MKILSQEDIFENVKIKQSSLIPTRLIFLKILREDIPWNIRELKVWPKFLVISMA